MVATIPTVKKTPDAPKENAMKVSFWCYNLWTSKNVFSVPQQKIRNKCNPLDPNDKNCDWSGPLENPNNGLCGACNYPQVSFLIRRFLWDFYWSMREYLVTLNHLKWKSSRFFFVACESSMYCSAKPVQPSKSTNSSAQRMCGYKRTWLCTVPRSDSSRSILSRLYPRNEFIKCRLWYLLVSRIPGLR